MSAIWNDLFVCLVSHHFTLFSARSMSQRLLFFSFRSIQLKFFQFFYTLSIRFSYFSNPHYSCSVTKIQALLWFDSHVVLYTLILFIFAYFHIFTSSQFYRTLYFIYTVHTTQCITTTSICRDVHKNEHKITKKKFQYAQSVCLITQIRCKRVKKGKISTHLLCRTRKPSKWEWVKKMSRFEI